jgi:hypothetical protein
MADFSIASQTRPVQLPDQLQQFGQFNQIAMQQAQMAKAQSDANAQNRLRSLNRNSPEFLNQLYAMDPAKGMAFQKGMEDLAESRRNRNEAGVTRAKKLADEKALLDALRGSTIGDAGPQQPDARVAANALLGQGKLGPAITALSASEAFTKDTKAKSDLAKIDIENLDKDFKTFSIFSRQVRSPQDAGVYAEAMYDHPTIGKLMQRTGLTKEQAIAKAQQDYAADPARWLASHVDLTGQQAVDTLKQTTTNTDLGGQMLQQQRDVFGRSIEGGETRLAKTLSPKDIKEETDTSKKVARTITDDKGNVTALNDRGEVVVTLKGIGAPSAARQKAMQLAETMPRQLSYAISELENAIKPGGDLEKATGSGIGAGVDVLAGVGGYATPGSLATARLRPVQDIVLKMVPRFEGPQSNLDVISYRQAAGDLANDKLPVKSRQEAAKTIIRLMKARKDEFVTPEMAAGDVPVERAAGDALDANNPLLK